MGNELTREQQRKQDQLAQAQNEILQELQRIRLANEQEKRLQANARSLQANAGARQGAAPSIAGGGGPPTAYPPTPSATASFAFSRNDRDVTATGGPSSQAMYGGMPRPPIPPRTAFVPSQPSAPLLVATSDSSLGERRSPQRYSIGGSYLDSARHKLYPDLIELDRRSPTAAAAAARDFVFVNRDGSAGAGTATSRHHEEALPTCASCDGRLLGAPIYQCGGGHSGCGACRSARRACKRCRQPLTDMRSFAVEALIAQMKYPCPNSAHGCKRTLTVDEEQQHVRECPFGEVFCPAPPDRPRTCFWTGRINALGQHFSSAHPERCAAVDSERALAGAELRAPHRHLLYLLTVGVYAFELHVETRAGALSVSVRLLGTRAGADKWTYEVHVYNKAEPRRKFLYADACAPAAAPPAAAAHLPAPYAAGFLNRDQLVYKVFVKKAECEVERDRSCDRGRSGDRGPAKNRRPRKRNDQ